MEQGEIILYQPDEAVKLEVRLEDETVWLTQEQIADLFGTKRPAITKHLNNIYKSGELDIDSTCSILEHMGNDGKQRYTTKYYNLDAILSIGYRVNSKNATLFRKWANSVLKDYLLKGYSINKRLSELERTVAQHTEKIDFFVRTALPPVEGIFYNGQIFDAYKFATDLVKSARRSIVLIDNYVDETVLLMLSKRSVGVSATIYTQRITQQLQLDLDRHNSQYPPIDIRTYRDSHDRFLIVDETDVYHIGASLKDLGKKMFAFSKLDIPAARQSTERQVVDLERFAAGRGYEVTAVFEEKISGRKANIERPVLSRCLEYCTDPQNRVDMLLLTEISRLGRSTLEILKALDTLHTHKICVYIQNLNLETLRPDKTVNPLSSLITTLLGELAAIERQGIIDRLNSGRELYIQKGGRLGRKPGSRKTAEQRKEEYREAIALLKKGYSIRNVAKLTGKAVSTIQQVKKDFINS